MKEIPLTQGFVALVDDEDYEELSRYKWHAHTSRRGTYAIRFSPRPERRIIHMHRVVLDAPDGLRVDHKRHSEGRIIDNRRENLRLATGSQNQHNQRKQAGRSSCFKGVTWHIRLGRWVAQIKNGPKRQQLGTFAVEANAAYAYDLAAVAAFGEFALTNFPVPGSTNWLFG